jgi:hypothetical protein
MNTSLGFARRAVMLSSGDVYRAVGILYSTEPGLDRQMAPIGRRDAKSKNCPSVVIKGTGTSQAAGLHR